MAMDGCWKSFGHHIALQPTSYGMDAGSVALVSGANGAGKSTFLRVAAGGMRPSGGRHWMSGTGLYLAAGDGGRAVQSVRAAVYQVAALTAGDANGAMALTECGDFADRRVAELSRGQHARLTLAVAVAAAPRVLCLDEPAAHLDADGHATLWSTVRALAAAGSAVIVAAPIEERQVELIDEVVDAFLRIDSGHITVAA